MKEMEISKNEFESILSVATSSQVEVYEKVKPQFPATYEECKSDVLGVTGTAAVEDNNHESLTVAVKQWVAIRAFLAVFRQLDLVLTPTGFGVVSTNQMAPASKQRVDALVGHLRDSELVAHGRLLVELCRLADWGTSPQALEGRLTSGVAGSTATHQRGRRSVAPEAVGTVHECAARPGAQQYGVD